MHIGTVLGPLWQLQEQKGRRRIRRRKENLEKREEKV